MWLQTLMHFCFIWGSGHLMPHYTHRHYIHMTTYTGIQYHFFAEAYMGLYFKDIINAKEPSSSELNVNYKGEIRQQNKILIWFLPIFLNPIELILNSRCFVTGKSKSSFGWTALHMAIHHEHHEIMEALITVRYTNRGCPIPCRNTITALLQVVDKLTVSWLQTFFVDMLWDFYMCINVVLCWLCRRERM